MGLLKGNQHVKWSGKMAARRLGGDLHVGLRIFLHIPHAFLSGTGASTPQLPGGMKDKPSSTSSSTSCELEVSEVHPSSPLLLKELCFPCIASSIHLKKLMNYDFLKTIPWQILSVWSGLHFLIFMSISYPLFLHFWTSDTIPWPQEKDYSASWEIEWRDWVISSKSQIRDHGNVDLAFLYKCLLIRSCLNLKKLSFRHTGK